MGGNESGHRLTQLVNQLIKSAWNADALQRVSRAFTSCKILFFACPLAGINIGRRRMWFTYVLVLPRSSHPLHKERGRSLGIKAYFTSAPLVNVCHRHKFDTKFNISSLMSQNQCTKEKRGHARKKKKLTYEKMDLGIVRRHITLMV